MIYWLTCFFLRIFFRLFSGYKAYGMENIPKRGSFILASNHVSFLDPLVIGSFVKRDLNYIAKKELFGNKFFAWYFRKLRIIPVDRDRASFSGMKEVFRNIKQGTSILIFPEGTRGDGDTFLEPEAGVAHLCLRFDIPVVPVYVKGTEKALPKKARFIKLERIKVYYGKPVAYKMPAGCDKDETYKKISHEIMGEIGELKNQHARD